MKVRATRLGYYEHKRRYPADHAKGKNGKDVFTLVPIKVKDKNGKEVVVSPEAQFSPSWMEKLEDGYKGKPDKKAHKVESDEEAI